VEDTTYTLSWDKDICSWAITGQSALKPTLTEAQQQIVDLLESEERNWTVGEISKDLEKSKSTISEQAAKLFKLDAIECPCQGQYRAKNAGHEPFGCSASYRETEQPNGEKASSGAAVVPSPKANPAGVSAGEPEIW
jgi:DNA-binding transcriptional ArsR family regulator